MKKKDFGIINANNYLYELSEKKTNFILDLRKLTTHLSHKVTFELRSAFICIKIIIFPK